MRKVNCPECNKTTLHESSIATFIECSYCFIEFDASTISSDSLQIQNSNSDLLNNVDLPNSENILQTEEIIGLTLIYQINQQQINILTSAKTTLGRNSFGANVLSEIYFNGKPVVSRKHCSIEFRNKKFYLQDESSLNGTFYGDSKISCKDSPQIIEDESLIYLGEELFQARIRYKSQTPVPQNVSNNIAQEVEGESEADVSIKYRCNDSNCSGFESDIFFSVCPNCKSFDSLIKVYI